MAWALHAARRGLQPQQIELEILNARDLLVTTVASELLSDTLEEEQARGLWGRFHHSFNRGFERMHNRSQHRRFIAVRGLALFGMLLLMGGSMLLLPVVGEDFFPKVDAGMMRLHVRVATGTRIEQTERIVDPNRTFDPRGNGISGRSASALPTILEAEVRYRLLSSAIALIGSFRSCLPSEVTTSPLHLG